MKIKTIATILTYLALAGFTFIINGCKKEGCTDPSAENYNPDAKKSDGSCVYSGCNDPYKSCQNGGNCLSDGSCECPTEYEGPLCEDQVTPSQIRITKVIMDEFTPTDGGSNWDGALCGGAYPDVYIELEDGSGTIFTSYYYTDCTPGNSYTYTNGLPVSSSNVNNTWVVRLYDNDTGGCAPDDYMGGVQKTVYSSDNGFPSTIRFNYGQIDVTFYVEYEF